MHRSRSHSHLKRSTCLLAFLTLLLTGTTVANAQTKPTITWPYFSFPTWFIVEDDALTGTGSELQEVLYSALDEYDHKEVSMAPKRMFEELRSGKQVCLSGPVFTSERAEYVAYSLPCRVAFNDILIVRREIFERFEKNNSISIKQLLSTDLKWGVIESLSYGEHLDALFEGHDDHPGRMVVNGPNALNRLIEMLSKDRLDWLIGLPSYLTIEHLKNKLVLVPIMEKKDMAVPGHIICPDTAWGRGVIATIDTAIRAQVHTGRLKRLLRPWVDKSLHQIFDDLYEKMIVKPAQAAF